MAQVFLDDGWHGHAKRSREILHGHGLLLFLIRQKVYQAICQIRRAAGFVEFHRELFPLAHLAKVGKVGAYDRHAVGAGQVSDTAATGRRGIRHYRDRGPLKKTRKLVFMNVPGEFNRRILCVLLLHRFHISRRLWMVAAGDDQLGARQSVRNKLERFEQQFKPLVCSPLAESQNAMLWISAPRKIWVFGFPRENAVRTQVNIVAPVFFVKNLAVARH
jgi:hypothetical protein